MNDPKNTTIMISKDTKEKLDELKLLTGQSTEHVIKLLLEGKVEEMKRLKKEIDVLLQSLPPDINPAIVLDKVLMGKSPWLDNWAVN